MRALCLSLSLALATLLPEAAIAQDPATPWYFAGRGGVSFLTDADNSGGGITIQSEHDPGFVFDGALGYAHESGLRGELAVGYRESSVNDLTITNDGGIGILLGVGSLNGLSLESIGIDVDGHASALTAMANGYFDVDLGGDFKPFVGAGVGLAHVESKVDLSLLGQTVNVVDDSDTVFAYQGMAGVSYEMDTRVLVSLTYSYLATTDPQFEDSAGNPFDSEYASHNLMLGMRYHF